MRRALSLIAVTCIAALMCLGSAHADHWKITSRGAPVQKSVWAIDSHCSCSDNCPCTSKEDCAEGKCTVVPTQKASPMPMAPQYTSSVITSDGSCSSGQCGGASSGRGLFRRR